MPYRSDRKELESRREELVREVAEIQAKRRALSDVDKAEAKAKRALAQADRMLGKLPRKLSLLESVKIAAPCSADWEDMKGDDRVRFCTSCSKNVFNLSEMAEADAERLLLEKDGNACVRLYRRIDGTVLTADCPEGVRRRRLLRRSGLAVLAAGSGLAAVAALPFFTSMGGLAPDAQQAIASATTKPVEVFATPTDFPDPAPVCSAPPAVHAGRAAMTRSR